MGKENIRKWQYSTHSSTRSVFFQWGAMARVRLRHLGGDLGALSGRRVVCALAGITDSGRSTGGISGIVAATEPYAVPLGAVCGWDAELKINDALEAVAVHIADAQSGVVMYAGQGPLVSGHHWVLLRANIVLDRHAESDTDGLDGCNGALGDPTDMLDNSYGKMGDPKTMLHRTTLTNGDTAGANCDPAISVGDGNGRITPSATPLIGHDTDNMGQCRYSVQMALDALVTQSRTNGDVRAHESRLAAQCAAVRLVFLSIHVDLAVDPIGASEAVCAATDPSIYYRPCDALEMVWKHREAVGNSGTGVFALVLAADQSPQGGPWLLQFFERRIPSIMAVRDAMAAVHCVSLRTAEAAYGALVNPGLDLLPACLYYADLVALAARLHYLGLAGEHRGLVSYLLRVSSTDELFHAQLHWALSSVAASGANGSWARAPLAALLGGRGCARLQAQRSFWASVLGAVDVRGRPSRRSAAIRAALERRMAQSDAPWPPREALLPWRPSFVVSGLATDRVRVYPSAGRPVLLVFRGQDGPDAPISTVGAIVKRGGDVSRDAYVMRLLSHFDALWAEAQDEMAFEICGTACVRKEMAAEQSSFPCVNCRRLAGNVRARPHGAQPFFEAGGAVEWLPEAVPLSEAPKVPPSISLAGSVAAWAVATFVLGVGDRHGDNVLVSPDLGLVTHVDCAWMWGAEPRPFAPAIRLCSTQRAMAPSWDSLRATLSAAYSALRHRSGGIVQLVISSPAPPGRPHVHVDSAGDDWLDGARDAASFVHSRLSLGDEAFGRVVDASADALLAPVMDALHSIVQSLRE